MDRAAEDKAVLVPAEVGLGAGGGKEIAGVQAFVAEEFEEGAAPGIGAGLLVHEDDAAVGAAVFGGVAIRFDAELFDGVDDGVIRDLTGFGLEDADAVVDVLADARAAAVDAGKQGAWGQAYAGGEG